MPPSTPAALPEGPLHGLRVLDLSRFLAGPYVGRLLCDLGADVLKLEPPQGDDARHVAPRRDRGMSGLYTWVNAGKRNLSVDLAHPDGLAIALELAERADVVIENFRPGVADRLGVGWDAIHARSPRTVLVSINGFGASSSWSHRRGFAHVVHAATGVLRDQAERTDQPVAQIAQAYGDIATAFQATVGLLAALRQAERTGRGEHLEVAMFDAVLASYTETNFALLDPPEARDTGLLLDAGPHGLLAVAGSGAHVWKRVSAQHGIDDPAPGDTDVARKARLRREALEGWMAARASPDALVAAVEEAGLACAVVASLRDALLGPLATERGLLTDVDDRRGGHRPVVRSPWRFSSSSHAVRGPAPRRGEHNDAVLRDELDYDDARIRELERAGVVSADLSEA